MMTNLRLWRHGDGESPLLGFFVEFADVDASMRAIDAHFEVEVVGEVLWEAADKIEGALHFDHASALVQRAESRQTFRRVHHGTHHAQSCVFRTLLLQG